MKKTITKTLAVLMITTAAHSTWAYDIVTLPFALMNKDSRVFDSTRKLGNGDCTKAPHEFFDFFLNPIICTMLGVLSLVSDNSDQLAVSPEFNQFLNESGLSDEEIVTVNNDMSKLVNAFNSKDTNAIQSMQFSPVTAGVFQINQ